MRITAAFERRNGSRGRPSGLSAPVNVVCRDGDYPADERRSASPLGLTGASMLTRTVVAKLTHRATKPAFNPPKGSLLLRIRNAAPATPAIIPLTTSAIATTFQ